MVSLMLAYDTTGPRKRAAWWLWWRKGFDMRRCSERLLSLQLCMGA